jgi:hypothetical protein
MIRHELLRDQRILIVTPMEPLEEADFAMLAKVVDPFIASEGGLNGLMVYTESFPRWSDFAGLVAHLKFVKDHHRHIAKVAAVTDSGFLSILPRIADHFVHAEVRHFPYGEKKNALTWLGAGDE